MDLGSIVTFPVRAALATARTSLGAASIDRLAANEGALDRLMAPDGPLGELAGRIPLARRKQLSSS